MLAVAAIAVSGLWGGAGTATRPSPAGAAATGLSVDQCVEVDSGDTFEISIAASDVNQLLAWDVLYSYNRQVVEVLGKDVRLLLESLPNSNVFDLSDPVPNSVGIYRMGAADTGGSGAAESGGGILAVLTLRAKQKGLSWSTVYRGDLNGDGTVDLGPTLTAINGVHIGDNDGDGIFDGALTAGQIAVDRGCAQTPPTAPPPQGVSIRPAVNVIAATPTAGPGAAPGDDLPSDDPPPADDATGEASEDPDATAPAEVSERESSPVPSSVDVNFADSGPTDGESGGTSLSTWLIGLIVGSAAVGVALSYVIYRTSRRPA
jgi:hypothetical protein